MVFGEGLAEWDKQIEMDSESGKLDFLIEEALDEKSKGQLKELSVDHKTSNLKDTKTQTNPKFQ